MLNCLVQWTDGGFNGPMTTTSIRINDLHRRHRAAHIELRILLDRGLDYTDRFADVAGQLAAIERELAGVAVAR